MSSWIAITTDDFADVLSAREIETMRELAADAGDDPEEIFARMIGRVTVEVREAVANNRANALGAEGSLPSSLANAALDILCFRLLKRFSQVISDPRRLAYEKALELLKDVATAKRAVLGEDGAIAPPPADVPAIVASDPAYGNGGVGIWPVPDRYGRRNR